MGCGCGGKKQNPQSQAAQAKAAQVKEQSRTVQSREVYRKMIEEAGKQKPAPSQ